MIEAARRGEIRTFSASFVLALAADRDRLKEIVASDPHAEEHGTQFVKRDSRGSRIIKYLDRIPERFSDGRRFHWRVIEDASTLDRFQVYSIGLVHWASCPTADAARCICTALDTHFHWSACFNDAFCRTVGIEPDPRHTASPFMNAPAASDAAPPTEHGKESKS